MAETTKGGVGRVPRFRSVDEEAAFWDTHSPLDYPDEFREVELKVARPLKVAFAIRLEPETMGALSEIAKELGIGPSTLARMWILERLKAHRESGAAV